MRIIEAVNYRHVAVYLTVVGDSKIAAERNVSWVRRALVNRLPARTEVKPGRYKGSKEKGHTYEIPVLLLDGPKPVRAVLAEMALRGRP